MTRGREDPKKSAALEHSRQADQSSDQSVIWLPHSERPASSPVPIISVVMVSYFTGATLDRAIDSVLNQQFPVELIIVDNGNPVGVREHLDDLAHTHPAVQIRSGHGNIGFARACNLGAKVARGQYLLFLNPDAVLPDGALQQLFAEGLSKRRPWMIGPRLVNEDGTEQRGGRREVVTPWNVLVEGLKLYTIAPNHPKITRLNQNDAKCPERTAPTPVISGACMLLPKEDYWSVGGMDEGYFLHVEDIDFCYRFRLEGGQAYFVPHVEVMHSRGTSRANHVFVEWNKAKGFIRYFWKNFKPYYPILFLLLLSIGIIVFFLMKIIRITARKFLGIFGR